MVEFARCKKNQASLINLVAFSEKYYFMAYALKNLIQLM